MPVPPSTDLLATISMFEQIKSEPIGFYSACPPPGGMPPGQQVPPRADSVQSQQSVITSINEDNKELQQQSIVGVHPPGTPMSQQMSAVPKQEVMGGNAVHQIQTPSSSGSSRSKPQACKVCGKMLSSASSYYVHMKLHSGTKPFACTVCEAAFCRKPYLEVHMRTHTGERPFQCDLCLKRFSQKSSLNTHKRIHTGSRPFQCPTCLKTFTQKCALTLHSRVHSGYWSVNKPFQCPECQQSFVRKPYLDIHLRTHSGERPFQCDFPMCLKRFTQKSTLNIHKKTHNLQGRPFACPHCPASFVRKPYLVIHLRMHTGERPFECGVCLKRFAQKSTLNIHKRIHTGERPYACDICNKTFAVKSYVTAHRWSHVSEKPLSCDRCSMTFTSKSQFAIHIRTHSAGQNYECNICGRTFIRDSYLIRHHNRVHRDNRGNSNNITQTINSVVQNAAAGHHGNHEMYEGNNTQVCDLRYVSDLQNAVSQLSSPQMQHRGGQSTILAQRHDAQTPQPPPNQTTININDRNRIGLSNLSGVDLNERLMQERAAHNRLVQERVLQERALQERAIQERALQERALQESHRSGGLHAPPLIIPASHVIATHDRVDIKPPTTPTSIQNNIASPGPV